MKHFQILLRSSFLVCIAFLLTTCSSDSEVETQNLTFNFEMQVDGEPIVFDTKKYLTPNNQNITLERVKIYLSNIQLWDLLTNEAHIESDSYHLISFDASNLSASFTLENVPVSNQYSEIKFSVGVDPEANTSIDHVGDLDPTNSMAWDWNTGYKFLLLEGRYFAENEPIGEEIKMHIGTDKNYFTISWLLDDPISMTSQQTINFSINAMAPIGTTDFSEGTVFMNDERGDEVAKNYREGLILIK